ncbi:hypothetical protein CC80DRAFT_512186 [Byssothecium circinans]|uniref:A-kinase anchor protein 7-like phosphoesterase domain-containing protein n=1 Tax=Byssothecium circinans TaxID=147558 RepID=A0A6A5UGM0_9PLEO|nr:hypothetical protein CC80DRAFT_512186 [Byssothecium circinans]
MARKKATGEYNDFLDGEKLRDNAEIRTSLQGPSTLARDVSPPRTRQKRKGKGKWNGKGGPKKPQLTHFLCLPLVNETSRPQLGESLEKLKEELGRSGLVPLKAIRPVSTLHLTLGVMSLNDEELEKATRYLEDLDLRGLLRDVTGKTVAEKAAEEGSVCENLNASVLLDAEALYVDLEALVPMQKPGQTSILYAEPTDASLRLLPFGEVLKRRFTQEGFMVEDKRSLRLHATIINTVYAKPTGRGRDRKANHRDRPREDTASEKVDHLDDGASTADWYQDIDEPTTASPDPSTAENEGTAITNQWGGSIGHGPNTKFWMRFNARELIEKYKDIVWAKDVRIDRVQICKMGAKKVLDADGEIMDEEYEVVAQKVI